MAPGLAVTVVLLAKPASAGVGAGSARKVFITAASVLSALTACVSVLVYVLIGNLASAHIVDSGRPVSVWLQPGVYGINQDPASDGDPSFFSVAGRNGPVEVTSDFSPLEVGEVGGLFLGASRNNYVFSPAGHFRITSPGEYRLVNDNEGFYPAVLVTVPYSVVAKRTLPWIVGNQAAFAVMLLCLALRRGGFKRRLRARRPGELPASPGAVGSTERHA
jgi:hypothetical protein